MIDEDAPEFVGSFARGLAVIRCFNNDAPRQTLTEVAENTGMARAAARRFLLTLEALGYAESDGKYFSLTPKVFELGYAFLSSLGVGEALSPHVRRVAEAVQETCAAAVLDRDGVVFVARTAGTNRVMSLSHGIGVRLPAYCSSVGQVLLAHLEPERLQAFLQETHMVRYTDATLVTPRALTARLAEVRARGWAICEQEWEVGLRALAVPLRDASGQVAFALGVSVQAARVPVDVLLRDHLPVLQAAARAFEGERHPF